MTHDDEQQISRIEDERREREAEFLLILLGVVTESYTRARYAVKLGTDPVIAARAAWLGHAALEHEGASPAIAEQLAHAEIEGVRRAYRLAGVQPPKIDLEAFDRIAAGMQQDAQEFAERTWTVIEQKLSPAFAGMADRLKAIRLAFKDAGVTKADSSTLEKGIERQVVQKHNAGLWKGARTIIDPKHHLVGFELLVVQDAHTTEICMDRVNVRLPPDHPFWLRNWAPLHWGCRTINAPLFGSVLTGESKTLPTIPPAPGFGHAPSADLGSYFGVTQRGFAQAG